MKIAVPYENGMVFQHFGHTAEFKFYEVENGQVTASEVVSTNGQGTVHWWTFWPSTMPMRCSAAASAPGHRTPLHRQASSCLAGSAARQTRQLQTIWPESSALTPTPIVTTTTTARATIAVNIIAAGTPAASNP